MRPSMHTLFFIIISLWISVTPVQTGSLDPSTNGLEFVNAPSSFTLPDSTPVDSLVARLEVRGIERGKLACRISNDSHGGLTVFAVEAENLTCSLTLVQDLSLLSFDVYQLTIQATDTDSLLTVDKRCFISVVRAQNELYCSDSLNLTIDSNIEKDAEFDIPCMTGDIAFGVLYELRLPTQDLFVTIDDALGKIRVKPPIPCGVDYDYLSVNAMTPGVKYEIKIHFHIRHINRPSAPTLQLHLLSVTWTTADFDINITHSQHGARCPGDVNDSLSYQYVLEVKREADLAVPRNVFEKGTTSLRHTVSGLKPNTTYVAVLRAEGDFNSSSAPLDFTTSQLYTFTVRENFTLIRSWIPELANDSSPEFLLTKFYTEDLIDHLMITHPSYYDSEVLSFDPNRMLVSLTERVSNPQLQGTTGIVRYLARQLSSDFQATDTWIAANLKGLALRRNVPSSLPIIEGSLVVLTCNFIIVHFLDRHSFQISWRLNDSPINFRVSQTMYVVELDRILFTSEIAGMDTGPLTTYFYRYSLHIPNFRSRHAGEYSCHLNMTTESRPSSSMFAESLFTDIDEGQVFKPAHVSISPLTVFASRRSTATIQCTFSNVNRIVFVDDKDRVWKTHISQSNEGVVEMGVNSSLHSQIQCQGQFDNFANLSSKSKFVTIILLDEDSIQCPHEVDYVGIQWDSTPVGETAVQACPDGYQGYVSRQCQDDGMWKPTLFIDCIRDDWILINEEIRKVTEDGIDISSQFINNVTTRIGTSLDGSSLILSSDIQQVANILDELGLLTVGSQTDSLVEYQALDRLASITDTILSGSDRQWEDVLLYERNNSMTGSGNKIIVAMDQLVVSSMRTPSISSSPIVKEKIAIKPSTLALDDINFPDEVHEEYEQYDNWVLDSGDKAFLSGDALKTGEIRYSVILLREVSSKMSVDPGRQNLSEQGRIFNDKQVRSNIISFSLSRNVNPLSPKLQLTFKVSQENFTSPECGFLDTTFENGSIWSSEGCETVTSGSDMVQCLCSHLTNFAILMSPTGYTSVSDDDHEILSIITYVGCGVSILFLLITLIVHFAIWRYIKSDRVRLHVHLSVCLLLSFVTFLAGIDRTGNEVACTVVAALLHYLFLASFFLMLGEGIHIFLSVTIVFHHKSVLWKLLLMAYGIPLLTVGASLSILRPDDYRRDDFCWLETQSGVVWAFLGPAALIILVNFVVFGFVLKAVLRDQNSETVETRSEAKSMMRAICILSPILGLAWVFGLLAINEDLVAFQYLFAVFNSLQGFFIFLFHCAFSSQIRTAIQASRRKQRAKSLLNTHRTSSSNNNLDRSI